MEFSCVSKKYQKLWDEVFKALARSRIARPTKIPKNTFPLVVGLIKMDAEIDADTLLMDAFARAKLNIEDPYHWWELMYQMILVHTDRPAGNRKKWTEDRIRRLERDCVKAGRLAPPTKVIKVICTRLKDDLKYKETAEHLAFQISRNGLTASIQKKIRDRPSL
jgi:hypothetical protein